MDLTHKPTKILITGKSGCGKSTYFNRYLLNSDYQYKFIFDHELEFCFRNRVKPIQSAQDLDIAFKNRQRVQVFDPSLLFPGELDNAFNFWCDYVFSFSKANKGKKLFACDELQKIVGVSFISHELTTLIETGRRYGIDYVAIAQQCNLLHNRMRNQLTEIVTFRHQEKRALQFLEEQGFDPEKVMQLPDLHYICVNLSRYEFVSGKILFDNRGKPDQIAHSSTVPDSSDSDGSESEEVPDEQTSNSSHEQA